MDDSVQPKTSMRGASLRGVASGALDAWFPSGIEAL